MTLEDWEKDVGLQKMRSEGCNNWFELLFFFFLFLVDKYTVRAKIQADGKNFITPYENGEALTFFKTFLRYRQLKFLIEE